MATIDRGPPGDAAAARSGPLAQHNRTRPPELAQHDPAPAHELMQHSQAAAHELAQHDRAQPHELTRHNPAPGHELTQHDRAPAQQNRALAHELTQHDRAQQIPAPGHKRTQQTPAQGDETVLHNQAPGDELAQQNHPRALEPRQHNPAAGQHNPAPPGYLPRPKPRRPIGAFRHWLFAVNLAGGLFLAGALLAPLSAALGWPSVACALYATYHFTCHQWAFRSFFLFGQQPVYAQQQLVELGLDPFTFVGSPPLGWKLAFCERDLAIYLGLLIVGLLYARRRHLQPAGFLPYTVLILPMALDGFTQLFGWRESTWELRVSTGLLFGLASAWLVLPRLDASFGLQPRASGYAPATACEPLSPPPPRE